jgi:hypothetical protein
MTSHRREFELPKWFTIYSTKPVEDRSEKDSKCNGADLGGAYYAFQTRAILWTGPLNVTILRRSKDKWPYLGHLPIRMASDSA